MSISIDLTKLAPLFQNMGAVPVEIEVQSVAIKSDLCPTMQLLEWPIESEFAQLVKGTPDFDTVWDAVLKMPMKVPALKARMLLPFVLAEGGDVWNKMLDSMDNPANQLFKEQLVSIFAWLLKHAEAPLPHPDLEEKIAEIESRCQPILPDDDHWRKLDVSDEDDVITQISAAGLLLTDQQLEIIWEKVQQRKMDAGKAQMIVACIWYFPPRFWKDRIEEISKLPLNTLPSSDAKTLLARIVNGYKRAMVKLQSFEAVFVFLRDQNCNAAMKGLFNLVWSRKEELNIGHLVVLLRLIEAPMELREMALYITENYERFREENIALNIVKKALFKDVMAIHLSDELVKDVFGSFYLDVNASEEKIAADFRLFTQILMRPENKKDDLLFFLEISSFHFLQLERWPRAFLNNHRSSVVNALLDVATKLAYLDQGIEDERRFFGAFFRRAKRLLSELEFENFISKSMSLSNNFVGERIFNGKSVLRLMCKEMMLNGERWFRSNLKTFESAMERDRLFDSISDVDGSWELMIAVYRLYRSLFPNKKDWIAKAIVSYVTRIPQAKDPSDLSLILNCLDRTFCPLIILKGAVTPGSSLIALLKKVDELSAGLPENSSQIIFDWANVLVKRTCPEAPFWIEAQRLYQSISRKIPKPKGKKGVQFSTVWKKFENKLGEVSSPEELLKDMISQKRAEVRCQTNERFAMALELYQKQYDDRFADLVTDSDDEFRIKDEGLEKILERYKRVSLEMTELDEKLDQELEKLHVVRDASELEKKLAVVSENLMKDAETKATQVEKEIEEIARSVIAQTATSYYSLWEDGLRAPVRKIEPIKLDKECTDSHIRFNALLSAANRRNEPQVSVRPTRAVQTGSPPESFLSMSF
ncbi:MAG: hypothetical protein ACK5MA_08290 [Parachlamydiaceae bacterium]